MCEDVDDDGVDDDDEVNEERKRKTITVPSASTVRPVKPPASLPYCIIKVGQSIVSVSYTHLDVYKRQITHRFRCSFFC